MILTPCESTIITIALVCPVYYRYKNRHQLQFFGRGHVAGIDIKVRAIMILFVFHAYLT